MQIQFASAKLEKVLSVEKTLNRTYGQKMAKRVKTGLAVLMAADVLKSVPRAPSAAISCRPTAMSSSRSISSNRGGSYSKLTNALSRGLKTAGSTKLKLHKSSSPKLSTTIKATDMNQPDSAIFRPDYAIHPGMLLEQELEHRELSQADFARRIARTPKLVSEIISGKNRIEPETAIQFERVLGIGADVWLRMEADFRLHQARAAEKEKLSASEQWLSHFPVKDLINWNLIRKSGTTAQRAHDLLALFGVASPAAFEQRYASVQVFYRRSVRMQASRTSLLTWLRYGEVLASTNEVGEYDKAKFQKALLEIRSLTNEKIQDFRPKIERICKRAGVAFVLIPPLPKTCLSGAAYWSGARRP